MRRLALCITTVVGVACNAPADTAQVESEVATINGSTTAASYDFGSTQVGTTLGPYTVTMAYAGYGSDTITAVTASCPDFSIDAVGLPADVYRTCEPCNPCAVGGSPACVPPAQALCCFSDVLTYEWTATFHPGVGGAVSCPVTVSLASGGTRTMTLSGTGTLPPVQISVQPTSVAFGDVRKGTDSTGVNIHVRNAGGGTMNISSVTVPANYQLLAGPAGAVQVPGGATQVYQLACHPQTSGATNGSFVIHSDDPANPDVSVPMTCNGIDSLLAITPSPATIPTTRVGEPVQANIVLQNSGNAPMNLEGVTVTGTDISMAGSPPLGTVGAGASKNVNVAFTATTAGPSTATLTVTYDGGQQRTSQISARALATSMSMTPDGDVSFGPVCAGQTKTQTFTILANDEGSFRVTNLATSGAPFAVTAPALPVTVAGSGASKLMFDIAASPTTAGDQTSMLTLATDIPGSAPRTINLSVSAIAAGVTPSPALLDFGPNTIETTTIGQSVHLSNCSASTVGFTRARIEGRDAAEFAIVAQPEMGTIPAAASASWLIVFQGHTIGPREATFLVDYDGGTASVALAGEGVGNTPVDPTNNPINERSYYTCSSSGGSSGFVWSLVVAFVVWRRRRAR